METDIGLGALIDATLNAVKEVAATVAARLLTSENYLKSVVLKLGLTRANNLPSKVGFTLPVALSARIGSTVTGIKCDHTNIFTS